MARGSAVPCRLGPLALLPLLLCGRAAAQEASGGQRRWPAPAWASSQWRQRRWAAALRARSARAAASQLAGPGGGGLAGASPTVTLEIRTCECGHAGTTAPVEMRLSANGSWQALPSPFREGQYFSMQVPAGTRRVELRILSDDGWCISSIRINWKPVVSGLPAWLDRPCENYYSCQRGPEDYGLMGCSSSHVWHVADLPDGVEPSFASSGCSNAPLLQLGNATTEGSVGECAARCLGAPLCTGFQFQPYAFCGGGGLPSGSCFLWNGECVRSGYGCFDQYVLNSSFVRPMDIPLVGRYVTYPAGSAAPSRDVVEQGGVPGWFSWKEEGDEALLMRLVGRELVTTDLARPKRGRVQHDGVIRWQSGAISFPRSRIAMPASANDSAADLLRVRTCDVEGAGTTITIQYRLSLLEDWAYLGAFFERNQWYEYSVGPGDSVQLRSLGADSWCVGEIMLGGVEVRSGLPAWLQRPPTLHASAIVAPGNIWSVEGRLPDDVAPVASRTGCSNWREIAAQRFSVEASVAACAASCRRMARCGGFQFLPYVACEGALPWGACQLWDGDCVQEQGHCFDQYRLLRGERGRGDRKTGALLRPADSPLALFASVLAAILVLCACIALVTSCGWVRSRRSRRYGRPHADNGSTSSWRYGWPNADSGSASSWRRSRPRADSGSASSSCGGTSSESESDLSRTPSRRSSSASLWVAQCRTTMSSIWEGATLEEKLQDPAWAAISLQQLEELYEVAEDEFGDRISGITMYDVNDRILQPLCDKHQKCYAHVVNGDDPLLVQVFVSHAWREKFQEFVRSVRAPFVHWTRKPTVWICATALVQSADTDVVAMQVGLGDDPREAPFTRALARAEKMLVVRNSTCDLYDRIWCCWELHLALEIGLVHRPGSMMVTGPQGMTGKVVDIASAHASSDEDKQKILAYIRNTKEGCEQVNRQLTEIRSFVF